MQTFADYQAAATELPVSLRNNRDRIDLPIMGLQEEVGKIGSLLTSAFSSGQLSLTPAQSGEMKNRLSDMLWYMSLLCGETKIALQDVAEHGIGQLQARAQELDPDRR